MIHQTASTPMTFDAAASALTALSTGPSHVAEQFRTIALLHSGPTEKAVVLLNGLGRPTDELRELGNELFNNGMNVLIPQHPCHGSAEKGNALADLTLPVLKDASANAIKLGQALGENVYAAGVSLGAAMALHGAMECGKVKRIVAIAPTFGFRAIPDFLRRSVLGALSVLPESEKFPLIGKRAPSGTTRGTAAAGKLFLAVEKGLKFAVTLPQKILVVFSPEDTVARHSSNEKFFGRIAARGVHVDFQSEPAITKVMHTREELKRKYADTAETHRAQYLRRVLIDFAENGEASS